MHYTEFDPETARQEEGEELKIQTNENSGLDLSAIGDLVHIHLKKTSGLKIL